MSDHERGDHAAGDPLPTAGRAETTDAMSSRPRTDGVSDLIGDPSFWRRLDLLAGSTLEFPGDSDDAMRTTAFEPAGSPRLPDPQAIAPGADGSGRYQILEEIARGGMGAVLRGRDSELNRELALKVLLERHSEKAELLRRFSEEARIGGQLQHPGVVPVYDVGILPDHRPFFAMKLVRGRTLAALLRERASPADDLPRFLAIFEQISQTLAYAHSRAVIHRDLKPGNVMVGAFGEVQVMDWGLAKILSRGRGEPSSTEPDEARRDEAPQMSLAGSMMGTPAYMAPEQARGEIERIDERADVFGLGAILCEILTGRPAFWGETRDEVIRKAREGDLADAMGRLGACAADPELIALAGSCLGAEPEGRPRDASAVARAITAYLSGVQERLRASELERVEALERARAERMRRRFVVALASAVLLAALVGGGWWLSSRLDRAARIAQNEFVVGGALARAEILRAEAQRAGMTRAEPWDRAVAAAEKAGDALAGRAVGPALEGRVEAIRAEVTREAALAHENVRRLDADRRLVEALDGARLRGDGIKAGGFDIGAKVAAYAAAFREAGIEPEVLATRRGAALLKGHEASDRIAAALDDWAGAEPDLARQGGLLAVARAIDPDPFRNRVRDAIAARDRAGLAALAREDAARELSATGVVILADQLASLGGRAEAVALLEEARARHPGDFWINQVLGFQLGALKPPRWVDAARYLTVAAALRPSSPGAFMSLGVALTNTGKKLEAVAAYREAVRLNPDYADAHLNLTFLLIDLGRLEDGVKSCNEVIRLRPEEPSAYFNLAYALAGLDRKEEAVEASRRWVQLQPRNPAAHHQLAYALAGLGRRDEAIAAYREALKLRPEDVEGHINLGYLLAERGDLDEAVAEFRKALDLRPASATVQDNLVSVLAEQGKLDEAVAEYRKLVKLRPATATVHVNLASTLLHQGKLEEAAKEAARAVELDRNNADAHALLGDCLRGLRRFPEARDALRRAHELGDGRPDWPYPTASLIAQCERLIEIGNALPAMLSGDIPPKDHADRMILGQLCYDRRLYAAACRFWREALDGDPKLADDPKTLPRYHAACTAAMAGLGIGDDRPAPDEAARAELLALARRWLRAELGDLAKRMEDGPPEHRARGRSVLRVWRYDPRLSGVREAASLAALPKADREAWTALWNDVDRLRSRTAEAPAPK